MIETVETYYNIVALNPNKKMLLNINNNPNKNLTWVIIHIFISILTTFSNFFLIGWFYFISLWLVLQVAFLQIAHYILFNAYDCLYSFI